MDSSTPLPETQAPAKEPSSDFKSKGNPESLGKLERVHIDELEMLSCELDALTIDPLKPSYEMSHDPYSIALVAYRFKTRARIDAERARRTKLRSLKNYVKSQIKKGKHFNLTNILDDFADPLECSCLFCCGPAGKPLELPKTEVSSDEEAFEGESLYTTFASNSI